MIETLTGAPQELVPSAGVSLGLVLPTFPQDQASKLADLPRFVERAEDAGVTSMWACDHLFWHGPVLECLTTLTVAAVATRTCTLGSAVLQLPLRRPAVVAKTTASIQLLSRGRLILGVGTGIHRGEYAAAGVDYRTRGRKLDEALVTIRGLWSDDSRGYAQAPRPEPIPVWVGGTSTAARRRAARTGDGWIPMFLDPGHLTDELAKLDADLDAVGRGPTDVTRALLLFVCTDRDAGRARERGLSWLSSLYCLPAEQFEGHVVVGEPAACADQLLNYQACGVQHLALFVADDDPLPQYEAVRSALLAQGATLEGLR